MLRLDLDRTPRWVDLPLGVRLFMRPAGTAEVHTYRTRAARLFNEMLAAYKSAREAGLPWDGSDLDDDTCRVGLSYALTLAAAARELVSDWAGVTADDETPLAFDRALLPRLLNIPAVADAFLEAVVAPSIAMAAEGNVLGLSPNGSTATVPNTAAAAQPQKRPAAAPARSKSRHRTR